MYNTIKHMIKGKVNDMKNYAYYRVSTATQAERNGIQMQQAVVENYCLENDIELYGVFADEGVSGTKEDRDGLLDLMASLERGDKIIVQNTSRLWRSDTVKVFVHRELRKIGADIVSVEQPNYTIYEKDPNNFLFNSIMEILDQYERMTISMKLAKGRKAKARRGGKSCGNAPIGYRWEGNEIVPDEENVDMINHIFNMAIDFDGNVSKIVRCCNANEYKTARGNNFSNNAIKNILTNDFYIGTITYAGNKTDGKHIGIIDKGLFNDVQALFS